MFITHQTKPTKTIQRTLKIKEELIATAWHPHRYETWCLDMEDIKEFAGHDEIVAFLREVGV